MEFLSYIVAALYNALETIKDRLRKYRKLFFVFNKQHKHPRSSRDYFSKFCIDNSLPFEIIEEINDTTAVWENAFYLVIKQEDLVKIIKKGRMKQLKSGRDYGLLAYNENPFYEVIENGIASIGVDWEKMANLAADFVTSEDPVQEFLSTEFMLRDSL